MPKQEKNSLVVPAGLLHEDKRQVDPQVNSRFSLRANRIHFNRISRKDTTDTRDDWEYYYQQDDNGSTQLHNAINKGLIKRSFFLINVAPHPCFLNILDDDRYSALHHATIARQPRIIRKLILSGADTLITTNLGDTALHIACKVEDFDCVRVLTNPFTRFERSMLKRLTKMGHRLPRFPQNLELRNSNGDTCLHLAVESGNIDIVRHLVRLGADLNAQQEHGGNGILHTAIRDQGRDFSMALLREFNFDLDIRNSFGTSAYEFALYYKETEVAAELVRLGASTIMKLYDPADDAQFQLKEDEVYDKDDYIKFLVNIAVTPKSV